MSSRLKAAIIDVRRSASSAVFFNCCLLFVGSSWGADQVDFAKQVLPILSNKCFVCHGPDAKNKDIVRLDSFAGATRDLGGHRAIDPTTPSNSVLIKRINSADDPMPPVDAEKQLTKQERETLTQWVKSGGKYAKHWAFVPPVKTTPAKHPNAKNTAVIDAFIEQGLASQNSDFATQANKSVLARRVALVLTGLPPEPEHLVRYLKDDRPDAYEHFVDELFKSPRFGEHQARYWLDAVRYGDTHGLHLDNKRGIYPYRDWVVRAFNQNLPLSQFIEWQIAGDLFPSPSIDELVATGYVRLNPSTGEGGAIAAEFQMKNNFDRVETLGTVFLGMSLTCARCHNHKYDPISQTEYYQLLAFFNNTAEPALDGNKYDYGPTVRAPKDQPAWKHWDDLLKQRDGLLRQVYNYFEKENFSNETMQKWIGSSDDQRLAMLSHSDSELARTKLTEKARDVQQKMQAARKQFTTSLIAKELGKARITRVLRRGEYNMPIGDPVGPGVPKVIGALEKNAPRNRVGLAKWLTSRSNPLVSRVLINRIWQRVFGTGLVLTPEDFGLQGQHPTHPELLDWLAVELQDSDWNLKHMLRLMVTSRTFRQSSARRTDFRDPENTWYSRGPSYRLDAEVLRDIGLWAGGILDPHMGGEGVRPYQPAGMWKALAHPASNTKQYVRDKGSRLYRRSLYVYWKRTSPHPMMTLFDAPDRESSCVRRSRTNTALQSLGLLNETQRIEMARALAERLLTQAKTERDRLNLLFKLIASRDASAVEQTVCLRLLELMRERFENDPQAATDLLSTGELSRNMNLNVADHAGWTQVAATVLASDAAILLY